VKKVGRAKEGCGIKGALIHPRFISFTRSDVEHRGRKPNKKPEGVDTVAKKRERKILLTTSVMQKKADPRTSFRLGQSFLEKREKRSTSKDQGVGESGRAAKNRGIGREGKRGRLYERRGEEKKGLNCPKAQR